MTIKDSPNVTITLARTTVRMLRAKKRDLETWDELMQRLGSKSRCEIECLICGAVIETTNAEMSPAMLAKANGWTEIAVKGRLNAIGFACSKCTPEEEA